MADAKITLSLSPHEFDLVRDVLRDEYQNCLEISKIKSGRGEPGAISAARRRAVELNDILEKLQ